MKLVSGIRQIWLLYLTAALLVAQTFGPPPAPGAAAAETDPGIPGPLSVSREEYTFGDTAFTPPGFPAAVEVTGSVHYPTDLSGGPFPLVVFLHGRHTTCFLPNNGIPSGGSFLEWPCTAPRQSLPSYRGYDYIAQVLASHGMIVVSISANGINARDNSVSDLGMLARAQLLQHHLDRWQTFATSGGAPFGSKFVGKINLNAIGTMGHSRGGEGVVRHYELNTSLGSPYGIKAVFPLAPTDFNRSLANGVPLAVMLPYCDGDVRDLQGIHFFDDVRYNVPGDAAAKHTVLVMGANHNFYNTVWTPALFPAGASDDWGLVSGGGSDPHCAPGAPATGRLSDAQQRGTGLAYMAAFFRLYLKGEQAFAPLLTGEATPPPSAQTSNLFVSYHAKDAPAFRRDVNRLLNLTNLETNTLGGVTVPVGMTPYTLCGGEAPQPQHCLPSESTTRQPHTVPSARAPSMRGLSQLQTGWNSNTAVYITALPAGTRDVSGYAALQFRASVDYTDPRNPAGQPQDLSVVLVDGVGNVAVAPVSAFSGALYYPPGAVGPVPKIVLNTVRLPLTAFTGVTLNDVQWVAFAFNRSNTGGLLISDLAFAR